MKAKSLHIILLFGLILVLSSGLGYMLYTPIDISPLQKNVKPWKPATQNASLKTIPLRSANSFTHITKRPVFNQDRRPFVKKMVIVKKPKPVVRRVTRPATPAQRLQLLGVLINATTKKALIGSSRDKKGLWLTESMTFQGWKIMEITDNHVLMKNGLKEQKLELYQSSGKQ